MKLQECKLLLCKCGTANYPVHSHLQKHRVTGEEYIRNYYQCSYCGDSYYDDVNKE